ncbi:hypothetical protein MMC17_002306 [Xylographa soralifera]|nr:hypothetical protein [Xylographa soralifera]
MARSETTPATIPTIVPVSRWLLEEELLPPLLVVLPVPGPVSELEEVLVAAGNDSGDVECKLDTIEVSANGTGDDVLTDDVEAATLVKTFKEGRLLDMATQKTIERDLAIIEQPYVPYDVASPPKMFVTAVVEAAAPPGSPSASTTWLDGPQVKLLTG